MIAAFLHWLGYGLCHQLPARSFFAGGYQVPVCARDTGIYVGFVVSLVTLVATSRKRPSELPSPWIVALALVFIGLMAADGVSSYAGWRTTTNEIRLATGLMTGYAMPVFLLPILNGQLWRRPGRERLLAGGARPALLWLATLPAAFVIVRWPAELLGVAYPLLVGAAIVFTFTTVNLTIVSMAPVAEGRAERLRDSWVLIVIALIFGLTEIAAAAAFKYAVTSLWSSRL